MRKLLLSFAGLAVIAISLWLMAPNSEIAPSAIDQPNTAATLTTSIAGLTATTAVASKNTPSIQQSPVLASAPIATVPNPAADFAALPLAQQIEIAELSGRDNSNNQIVEVKPGVFLMTNGPKVVPVAVMNEDGTVSIHEY